MSDEEGGCGELIHAYTLIELENAQDEIKTTTEWRRRLVLLLDVLGRSELMQGGTAAHRYAKALFGLAQDEHRHREVRAELENLGSLFEGSRELRAVRPWQVLNAGDRWAGARGCRARKHCSGAPRRLDLSIESNTPRFQSRCGASMRAWLERPGLPLRSASSAGFWILR